MDQFFCLLAHAKAPPTAHSFVGGAPLPGSGPLDSLAPVPGPSALAQAVSVVREGRDLLEFASLRKDPKGY